MTCGENNEIQVFKFYYSIPVKKYYFFIWNLMRLLFESKCISNYRLIIVNKDIWDLGYM